MLNKTDKAAMDTETEKILNHHLQKMEEIYMTHS